MALATFYLALAALSVFLLHAWRRNRQAFPLPPGPPTHPILGHLKLLPPEKLEETLYEWSKTYGACASMARLLSLIFQ